MKKLAITSIFALLMGLFPIATNAQCDNGTCTITISGTDANNDGWDGGASISIYQDNNLVGTFTVTGASNTQTYNICAGPIYFVWNSGTFDNECAFTITDSIGSTLYTTTSAVSLVGTFAERDACPTCSTPYDLAITNITGNSALITWTYDTVFEPDYFLIYVTDTNDGTPEEIFVDPNYDGNTQYQYLLTGLTQTTTYLVTLQSQCANDTSRTLQQYFSTRCYTGGEVTVGEGTAICNNLPLNANANHAYGQMIFEASEFANTDSIFGIRFYVSSNGVLAQRSLDIYIDNQATTSFSTASDFITMPLSKRHFSGSCTITSGWNEIRFTTPYHYTGSGDIILTFDDNTGTTSPAFQTRGTTTTDNLCIFAFGNSNIDPSSATALNSIPSSNKGVSDIRPNISFITPCGEASCLPPVILSATPSENSVALAWLPGGAESSFQVEYALVGTGNWVSAVPSTSNLNATVYGLASATLYQFRVSSLCDNGSASDTIVCATVCAPKPLPFNEDFEQFTASAGDNSIESCWARGTSSGTGYGPSVNGIGYNESGHSISVNVNDYLILPEMVAPADSLSISFYFRAVSSYGTSSQEVTVGVCTDQNNFNSFTAIETIQHEGNATDWQQVSVDLDAYTGNGLFIALTNLGSGYYANILVDDITVSYINNCRKVTNATLVSATQNTATISFTGAAGATNYTIFYGTNPSFAQATDSVTSNTTTKAITGLTPATRYYSWIRTNCGGNSHSSIAVGPVFSTACPTLQVTADNPWFEDFDNGELDVCMNNLRAGGNIDWQVATATSTPATAYSGTYMARFASTAGNVNAATILTSPVLNLSGLTGGAELSFYLYLNNADYDTINTLGVYYRTSANGNWNLIRNYSGTTGEWAVHYLTLPATTNAQNYQIGFRGANPNALGICLDNIEVHQMPACQRPSDITCTATDNRVTAHWNGTANSYRFEYRKVGTSAWHIADASTDSVIVTDLTPNTVYQARVRSNCVAIGVSDWSETVTFSTAICHNNQTTVNYNSGMTADNSTHAPAYTPQASDYCEVLVDGSWLNGISNISAIAFRPLNADFGSHFDNCKIYFGTTNNTTLSSFLYDSNSFTQVFSGSMNFSDTGWHYVTLDADYAWNGQGNLVVGFLRNSDFYSGTTNFAGHYAGSTKVQYASTSATTLTPDEATALTTGTGSTSLTPDLLFLNCLPSCEPTIVRNTDATYNSITVNFFSEGDQHQLQYRTDGDANWGETVTINSTNTGNQAYTITGLNAETYYEIRIRQVCPFDPSGYSQWVSFYAATDTACDIPTNFALVSSTADEATFSWTAGAHQDTWEIHVTSTNNYYQVFTVTSNPATISGLPLGRDFNVYCRALCKHDHSAYSGFSNTASFSNKCSNARSVHANATGTSVRVYWTAGSGNQEWLVSYGSVGYTVETMSGMVVADTTSVVITGLQPKTSYGFRVMSVCSDGWFGDWTSETVVYTGENNAIDGPESTLQASLSPNPANGSTTLSVSGVNGEVSVIVIDLNGRTVYSSSVVCNSDDCTTTLDISDLAAGAYFVRLNGDNINLVKKLVVK